MDRDYQWSKGAVVPVDAQVVGEALSALIQRNGALETGAVVNEARPDDSPLHPAFEWDDSAAAEQYRRQQAAYMIRHVRVLQEGRQQPAFVNVVFADVRCEGTPTVYQVRVMAAGGTAPERGWVRTEDALEDPVLRAQVLDDALKGIQAWRRRYGSLSELSSIFDAIDTTQLALIPAEAAA